MTQQAIGAAIYKAIMLKEIPSNELSDYVSRFEIGLITPSLYALELSASPDAALSLGLGKLYKTFFDKHIEPSEMLIWGGRISRGLTLEQIAEQFSTSDEFLARFASASSTSDRIKIFVKSFSELVLSESDITFVAELIDSGSLSWAEAGTKLAELLDAVDIAAAMLHTSLVGDLDDYIRPSATLEIDKTVATVITSAITVISDREAEDEVVTDYVGTSSSDTIYASSATVSIESGSGNDEIVLAENDGKSTKIIFEKNLSVNGLDSIEFFERGENGDVLDFSAFLTVPNLSLVETTVLASDITETVLPNGAVVVIEGTSLFSDLTIANLFGTERPFASPTNLSKYVFITANLSQDSDIWYVLNNSNTALIEASEITKVGTLNDVNSFSLFPFVQTNFHTLSPLDV
jgi:transcriptional regulator with XRE-family HTH domain